MDGEHNILLVGETGAGKSSLGNFIIGIENAFEVSDDPSSCTLDTVKKRSKIDPSISVIDTPGLQDSQGRDKVHYDQMLKIIKSMKNLHFIIVVLNFTNPRFTCSIQHMIKFLCNVFPTNFRHHIGIVFTHYDHNYQVSRNKNKSVDPRTPKMEKYIPELMRLISMTTNEPLFLSPPIFFLDTQGYDGDDNSQKELDRLIYFTKTLQPIENIRENCNIKYKSEKEEFDTRQEEKVENGKIVTYTKQFRRKKYTDYNGKVSYSDWEQFSVDKKERDLPGNVKGNSGKETSLAEDISNFADLYLHCYAGYNYAKMKKENAKMFGKDYEPGFTDFLKGWAAFDRTKKKKNK